MTDPAAPAEYSFPVTNLSCAGCVRRAETALANVPGVAHAAVNLAQGRATLRLGRDGTLAPVRRALAQAGYPMGVTTHRLQIDAMTCATCVARTQGALAAVPGVIEARVNLATGQAQVDAPEGVVPVQALRAALAATGYHATALSPDQPDDPQARALRHAAQARGSFLVALVLTLPVFVTEMGGHVWPPLHHALHALAGQQALWLGQFVLTALVLAGPGRGFFARGLPALVRGGPDMNTLVALGTGAAFAYSCVATFAPALLPEPARAVYFEAASVIVTLILLGRWLEARAKGQTGAAIAALARLQPALAHRLGADGTGQDVPAADLRPGDRVLVRPGGRLPADGRVSGDCVLIDESMLTGEPVPVLRGPGAAVTGGSVLGGSDALVMTVTRTGADSTLAQIIRMVDLAQGAKLPVQALVDRVTLVFVPVVLGLAVLTILVWLALGPGISFALVAGVSVLIIACPCAMGLATPTSIVVGTGRAAQLGVLFRKGAALQHLEAVRVIAFDKTGTLTEGRPVLTAIIPAPGCARADGLAIAAAIETPSEHPFARALVAQARAEGVELPAISGFKAVTGLGARADVAGQGPCLIGGPRFMAQEGVDLAIFAADAAQAAAQGASVLYLARGGQVLALFALTDQPKPEARATLDHLRARGFALALITGDAQAPAQATAQALGIDTILHDITPKAKAQAVADLRARFGPVAFVGDGINDAPALAAADVGIALGTGTDIAIESADVVLRAGDLRGVAQAHHLARASMRNIRQNLFWAFGYNAALIPVAAGLLYPAFGLMLQPVLAAAAMALSSVFVLTNALRLRGLRPVAIGKP